MSALQRLALPRPAGPKSTSFRTLTARLGRRCSDFFTCLLLKERDFHLVRTWSTVVDNSIVWQWGEDGDHYQH